MKRIYLQKIVQHGVVSYLGVIDAKDLVRVVEKVEMGTTQEAQRPLNEKKVKDIAYYVDVEKGILPNTITLATKDRRFEAHKCPEVEELYYILFPEMDAEYEEYKNALYIADGQHRLCAFDEDICTLSDDIPYQIGFTLYVNPDLSERRKIFISCNEKQDKVGKNLIVWLRYSLGLLSENERRTLDLVERLNNEYPLKGHIIMSAERIINGVKANEVMKALNMSKITTLSVESRTLSEDELLTLIRTYLMAWEKVAGFEFASSSMKEAGAAVKMSGLKYMLLLLPEFWEKAVLSRTKFTREFAEEFIGKLIASYGVPRANFFTCEEHKLYFREKSTTNIFAEQSKERIRLLDSESFNPLS